MPPSVVASLVLVGVLLEATAEEEEGEEEEEDSASTSSQLRSNKGVVVSWLPTMPKLGLGVSGAES